MSARTLHHLFMLSMLMLASLGLWLWPSSPTETPIPLPSPKPEMVIELALERLSPEHSFILLTQAPKKTSAPKRSADEEPSLHTEIISQTAAVEQSMQVHRPKFDYQWPVHGESIIHYGDEVPNQETSDYMLIETTQKEIAAIERGRVRYAQWTPGLGLTLIIDHHNALQSVYAYMDELLIQRGHLVQKGQKIARFSGEARKRVLYFALRKDGQSLDPEKIIRYVDLNRHSIPFLRKNHQNLDETDKEIVNRHKQ